MSEQYWGTQNLSPKKYNKKISEEYDRLVKECKIPNCCHKMFAVPALDALVKKHKSPSNPFKFRYKQALAVQSNKCPDMLSQMRTHARSCHGEKTSEFQPAFRRIKAEYSSRKDSKKAAVKSCGSSSSSSSGEDSEEDNKSAGDSDERVVPSTKAKKITKEGDDSDSDSDDRLSSD